MNTLSRTSTLSYIPLKMVQRLLTRTTQMGGMGILWRERVGVEPTPRREGAKATELKSARTTGPHPLPFKYKTESPSKGTQYNRPISTQLPKTLSPQGVSLKHPWGLRQLLGLLVYHP